MAQTITVKKKNINIKDTNIIVEDEVFPEVILFEVSEASSIHDRANLTWFLQYYRSSTDNGLDGLTVNGVTDDVMELEWHPSAGFTLNKGFVKVQIIGVATSGSSYTTRWSTVATTVNLPENFNATQLSPTISSTWLETFMTQLNTIKAQAVSAKESIDALTVTSETLSAGSEATVTKSTISGHQNFHFGIPRGSKGDKGDDGEDGSIVTVSATGTSTNQVQYITIDGVEYKITGTYGAVSWGNIVGSLSSQTDLKNALDAKADSTALTTHTSNTNNPHSVTKAQVGLGNVPNTDFTNNISAIEGKIPSQASSENQLADKSFVTDLISTESANYISNEGEPFTSVAQLEAYSGTVTNNDYAFVTGTDSSGNTYYDRYKATVTTSSTTWGKEYRLNNSSFTSAQWLAISSGISALLVQSYNTHIADTTIHVTSSDKTNWNSKLGTGDVVDNCTSTSTTAPLSANQGKILNDAISTLNNNRYKRSVLANGTISTTAQTYSIVGTPTYFEIYAMSSDSKIRGSMLLPAGTVSNSGFVCPCYYAGNLYAISGTLSNNTLTIETTSSSICLFFLYGVSYTN